MLQRTWRVFAGASIAFGLASTTAIAQPLAPSPEQQGAQAAAQSSVAAIVDDKVITTYDLAQRIRLMVISSGGRISPEMVPALERRALRDMIEEKLKLKEALRFEVEPVEADIDREIANIAAQSGLTPQDFATSLQQSGVDIGTLRSQLAASKIWPDIVQGRFGNRVRISDDEIDSTLERMREEATSEQYLVSEICIPVPGPDQAQQYYEGALQLIEQMRRGVPFAVVAQQFSACTSAAAGGDLGWVRAGELPQELDNAIQELPVGSVTTPIPSDGAFIVLAVRDKREAKQQGEKTYTFAYASAPLEIGRAEARQRLEKLPSARACGGSGGLRQDLGRDVGVAIVENVKIGDVDERFQIAVEDLDRGDLSPIIEADGYLHAAYVCELDEGLGIPSRRTVENRLFQRQLEKISQQYLRDVERRTMVDVRINIDDPQPQR
ncbi:MAG: peptidylprolyl isomerase [Pseudomonadota bacterium]